MTLSEQVQRSTPPPFIELFRLDASGLRSASGAVGPVLHFTNTSEISVGGQAYLQLPVELEGVAFKPGEAPPQPSLRLSVITTAMRAHVLQFDYLRGALLQVSRIFADPSDADADLDPGHVFGLTTWVLDQATLEQGVGTWVLRSALDKEGLRIPRRFLSRDHCPFTVRRWTGTDWDYEGVQCPYQGAVIWDAEGQVTADPTQEHFARTLSACCKRRFPSNDLPFGGFPGAERV